MWASKVISHVILSPGLPMRPFVWSYRRGVMLVLSWVMFGSVRSYEYVRPRMLLVCGVRFKLVIC